jgi:hypothetical protein
MTTNGYEARIAAFGEGKRLRRFRGALRPAGDTSCDACGSMLPAMLYGLRDLTGGRDYFVGLSCLRQLHQLGALEQPYVRMSIANAYVRARGAPSELQVYLRFGQRPERPAATTQ